MQSKDNVKTRFKLYKAGKMWLIAGTTFLALAGLGSVAVHADSNNVNSQSKVPTNQDVKVESTQSQDNNVVTVQNNDVTTPAQADSNKQDNSATDSKNATIPAQTDSNKQDNSAAENKDATPAQSDSNKQDNSATDNKNAADQANSTSVNSDTTSNTNANNQKVALLAADNQPDGWNTDHTQYTQGGQLLTGVHNIDGTYYDFDENHNIVKNNYVQSQWGLWYMFGNDGRIATKVTPWAGTYYYFDPLTYLRVDNNYVQSQWGSWYLFGNDGRVQSGVQRWAGTYYYFDPTTYLRVDNAYVQSQWGAWYMFGNDGRIVSGFHELNGQQYFFDLNTYQMVKEHWANTGSEWRYFDGNGQLTSTDFVTSIANGAMQTWYEYGVLPSVSIAQAICESNWGTAAPGNNLFGIKGSYNGQSQLLWTWEVYNGQSVHIKDWFRVYPTVNESVNDHGSFLYENSRYNNLLWDNNYYSVCNKLHQDGYATAPTYANTLINIIHASGLDQFDEGL